MRFNEILLPIDVHEASMLDLRKFINDNPQIIFESSADNTWYINKINAERSYTVNVSNLTINTLYAPIEILGVPAGKYISVKLTESDVMFVKPIGNKLWFRTSVLRDITFPAFDMHAGDHLTDILIFNNTKERDQFLSTLKLTFSDWQFKITNL